MKQITIAGRLGKDAELRSTQGGTQVCRFSVATDSKRGGEKVTTWFDVSIFGKRGEALCSHLRKGTVVCVVGDIDARTYEKNGETRMALGVVASEITLLGGGERGERSTESRSGGSYDRPPPHGGFGDSTPDDYGGDPDLPF